MKNQIVKIINLVNKAMNNFRSNESVFSDIYTKRKWYSEENKEKFNSGSGSDSKYAIPYVEVIAKYIKTNDIKSVVDLGCGDFRVGRRLLDKVNNITYIGIDVVKELIDYNNKEYGNKNSISFIKKDITKDSLPKAELYLVRQVFQHLSNGDISKALHNIPQSSRLIVTEHQQVDTDNIIPNIDKVRGGYSNE